jgi:hypothetical protein
MFLVLSFWWQNKFEKNIRNWEFDADLEFIEKLSLHQISITQVFDKKVNSMQ